jgi:hypothetical protein
MPAGGYAVGAPLYFRCGLFGFRTSSSPPHEGKVEVQVVLFRADEARRRRETRTMEVSQATLAGHTIAGQLDLDGLEPGEYAMQLLLWDRLSPTKSGIAVQWARFRVGANGAAPADPRDARSSRASREVVAGFLRSDASSRHLSQGE